MSEVTKFELMPCLKALLDCCIEKGTTDTHVLAESLSLSEETVDTYWKRIKATLGIQKRHEAVRLVREGRILSKYSAKPGGGVKAKAFRATKVSHFLGLAA
ncbi:LuxR C-terminal-related transcriptional regulator [Armatimonas sp.]|uniref:LuxR C-terminal-related transcriptional regulator n=1 Tax=Armatimonas sp. TaxID=1872638 RepID=UPI003750DFA1